MMADAAENEVTGFSKTGDRVLEVEDRTLRTAAT